MKDRIHLRNVLIPFIAMMTVRYAVSALLGNSGLDADLYGITVFLAGAVPALVIFYILAGGEEFRARPSVMRIPKMLLYTVMTAAFLVAVTYLVNAFLTPVVYEKRETGTAGAVLSVLFYPVMEEFIFRKLFYGELRKMNEVFGVLMQAVMFALVHFSAGEMIFALFAGIVVGAVREKSGNMLTPLLVHVLINLRAALLASGVISPAGGRTCDIVTFTLGFVAFAVLFIMKNSKRSENGNVEEKDT